MGAVATIWVLKSAEKLVLSPNHHPNPSQGQQKGFQPLNRLNNGNFAVCKGPTARATQAWRPLHGSLWVLHLPALPPCPGHDSLIHAIQTIGARVDALHLRHADLFRRVYALLDMIQRTFVRVSLDIVRQNVLSLCWQPMMLSQLRCGTKLDHLKLPNTIRHV